MKEPITIEFTKDELKTLRVILQNSSVSGSEFYNLNLRLINEIDSKILRIALGLK